MNNDFDEEKQKEAKNSFTERMNNFNKEDVESTINDGYSKFEKLASSIPKPLLELWEDIKLLINLLRDFYNKKYTSM